MIENSKKGWIGKVLWSVLGFEKCKIENCFGGDYIWKKCYMRGPQKKICLKV